MATGQTVLNLMELVDRELQLQPAEDDTVRGLIALNAAQDYLETILASFPNVKGSSHSTLTTTASTETTAFPTGLLRLDKMQLLDTNGNVVWGLDPLDEVGSHRPVARWPWSIGTASPLTGKPRAYYTNGTTIFWSPLPDGTHTVRYYGFIRASDITASGTVAYDDVLLLPLATFAARLVKVGLEDSTTDLIDLAGSTFLPAVRMLDGFTRDGAPPLQYRRQHDA